MEYRPLNSQLPEIRLLNLGGVGADSTTIRGTVEHVIFNHLPRYDALSYCWGAQAESRIIYLDSRPVPVRRNLYDALFHIRSRGHERLWVDAICINQADVEERNQQVYLMKSIFQRARTVIAWIGLGDELRQQTGLMEKLSKIDGSTLRTLPSLRTSLITTRVLDARMVCTRNLPRAEACGAMRSSAADLVQTTSRKQRNFAQGRLVKRRALCVPKFG